MPTKKTPCCHGFGLAADLYGAGYRWPVTQEQVGTGLARVNCDICGKGGTAKGDAVADAARHRLAVAKNKSAQR